MGLFILKDGVHAQFDKVRARFFWEAYAAKRKYHMVRWTDICNQKGGVPRLTKLELGSFGRQTRLGANITWSDGLTFVNPKTR